MNARVKKRLRTYYTHFRASTYDWRDYEYHRRILFNYLGVLCKRDKELDSLYLHAGNPLRDRFDIQNPAVSNLISYIEKIGIFTHLKGNL